MKNMFFAVLIFDVSTGWIARTVAGHSSYSQRFHVGKLSYFKMKFKKKAQCVNFGMIY